MKYLGEKKEREVKNWETASMMCTSLAVAVCAFTMANLYVHNGFLKLSFVLFPQTAVYVIIGFLHAWNVWELENAITPKNSLFMLLCYFLVYTAWYNIVLLPESGLGYMEWAIMLVVFLSNFITEFSGKRIKSPFMGQRPIALVVIGMFLFIAKMFVFYMFEDNIYDSMILTNGTARFFVVFFAGIGIAMLLMQLFKNITSKIPIEIPEKQKNGVVSAVKAFGKTLSKGIGFIVKTATSLLSLPVIIIIVCSIGLATIVTSFMALNKIYDDILKFVEPLLQKFLDTGENSIKPSNMYYTLQTISMVVVLFYTVWIENSMKKGIKEQFEARLNTVLNNKKYDYRQRDLISEKIKGRLQYSNVDDYLKICNNEDVISNGVNAIQTEIENEKIGD